MGSLRSIYNATLASREIDRDRTGFAIVVVATVVFTVDNEADVVFVEGVIHGPHVALFQNHVLLAAREAGKVRPVARRVGELHFTVPAAEIKGAHVVEFDMVRVRLAVGIGDGPSFIAAI